MSLLLLCLAFGVAPAWAEFAGRVVDVHDGSTLTVLVGGTKVRVRLDGIETPEPGQPYGETSKRSLSNICMGKQARVTEERKDRRGGAIGRVSCSLVDANAEQVRKGMAWVTAKYSQKNEPLFRLQTQAKLDKRGLWGPIPAR